MIKTCTDGIRGRTDPSLRTFLGAPYTQRHTGTWSEVEGRVRRGEELATLPRSAAVHVSRAHPQQRATRRSDRVLDSTLPLTIKEHIVTTGI